MNTAFNVIMIYSSILAAWVWHQSILVDSGVSLQARILPAIVPGIFFTGFAILCALMGIGSEILKKLEQLQVEDDEDEEEDEYV